jgi:hypothetical protein
MDARVAELDTATFLSTKEQGSGEGKHEQQRRDRVRRTSDDRVHRPEVVQGDRLELVVGAEPNLDRPDRDRAGVDRHDPVSDAGTTGLVLGGQDRAPADLTSAAFSWLWVALGLVVLVLLGLWSPWAVAVYGLACFILAVAVSVPRAERT